MSTTSDSASSTPKLIAFAIPLLGVMGAIQGSGPSINSTALLSLSRDLGMDSGTVALAASIQSLFVAATVITTGLMADRVGRRKVLLAALVTSAIGSILSGIAPISIVYLLGQAVTGIGLGAVYGAAFAYIRSVARPGKLPAALGIFGAVIGLASLILIFAGGLLVGVNWRLAFFVIAAASVIALFLVPLALPSVPPVKGTNLDLAGQILLGLGIIAALYGMSQLGASLTSPQTLIPLLLAALALGVFVIHESKYSKAFFPIYLFKSPIFIAAILAAFVYNFGMSVGFLQTTNLWQYITGVSTTDVAYWQIPLTAAGVISALITGRFMSRGMSNRKAILIGSIMVAVGFVMLALAAGQKSFLAFLPGSILAGAGIFTVSIPYGNLFIREAPAEYFGPVTSSRTTIGQFFYSVGFALATVIVDRLTIGGVTRRLTESGVQPDMIGSAVTSINTYVRTGIEPSTELGKQALADAADSYTGAFATVIVVSGVLMLVAGLVAVMLLRKHVDSPESADTVSSPDAQPSHLAAPTPSPDPTTASHQSETPHQ